MVTPHATLTMRTIHDLISTSQSMSHIHEIVYLNSKHMRAREQEGSSPIPRLYHIASFTAVCHKAKEQQQVP